MTPPAPTPADVPYADEMPMLGLGTWQNTAAEQCAESVRTALDMGYRHIDTAQIYRNEDAVGEGVAAADVDREEIFLATKVWTSNLARADVRRTTEESLERLGVDYVDLLYIHWPAEEYVPEETLPAFDDLVEDGLVRHLGVSNFEPTHVERARAVLDAPVFANQVECHPFLQQDDIRAFAHGTDLNLVAYSPLARGEVFGHPVLEDLAAKHDVSEAQVSLAWLRETELTAIPKATSEAHIRDNWQSLTLHLDGKDVARVDDIDRTDRQIHPDFAPDAWG